MLLANQESSSSSKKIVFLIERFYPIKGGAEINALYLAKELIKRGFYVTVVTQLIGRNSANYDTVEGVPVYRIDTRPFMKKNGFLNTFGSLRFLPFLLRMKKHYDLLVIRGSFPLCLSASIIKRIIDKKSIFMIVGLGELTASRRRHETLWENFINLLRRKRNELLYVDKFVGNSEDILKEYSNWGRHNRPEIKYIPNGVDTKIFSPISIEQKNLIRNKFDIPLNKVILLNSGKVIFRKGLDWLLKGLKNLRNTVGSKFVFISIGAIEDRDYYNNLTSVIERNNMSDFIFFRGSISNVNEYLQAADIFVLPSRSEGMPNSLLEAMSTGLPVVASNIGGVREIIRDGQNGSLVSLGDTEDLQKKLIALIEDPELRTKFSQNARNTIINSFSMDAIADRYADLFFKTLNQDQES